MRGALLPDAGWRGAGIRLDDGLLDEGLRRAGLRVRGWPDPPGLRPLGCFTRHLLAGLTAVAPAGAGLACLAPVRAGAAFAFLAAAGAGAGAVRPPLSPGWADACCATPMTLPSESRRKAADCAGTIPMLKALFARLAGDFDASRDWLRATLASVS